MSASLVIKIFIELALVLLLVYGFYHEDKVITFERNVKKIFRYYVKQYKRNKNAKALTVHKGNLRRNNGNVRVA